MNARRLEAWLLTGIFVLFLGLPALDMTFDLDPTPPPALQGRAKLPRAPAGLAGLEPWRDGFEKYLDDAFGWRSWAVRTFNRLNYRLFRVSEQKRAVVGRDGWLFFGSNAAQYHRATEPFSEEELRHWRRSLEQRRRWLEEQGIAYLFTVAPNKHSIYPEHLPTKFLRTGPASRYEQLSEYMAANRSRLTWLDLHGPLLTAKEQEQVYERTGTHWNSHGAFVAYRAILDQLRVWFPDLEPLTWEEIRLSAGKRANHSADLVTMLGLEGLLTEQRPRVVSGVRYPRAEVRRQGSYITEQDDKSLPRAVIFHDSFGVSLVPFLAQHFSYAVFQWRSVFDGELVLEVQPDVVIEEQVERALLLRPDRNILPAAGERP